MEAEKALERITPEEAGISSRQVKKCIEELMHETTQMHGFMAARHGKVFAECWWAPFNSEMVHSNHSFGKSYTATAIGIAVTEKKLSLDEKMVDIFKDEIEERKICVPELTKKITVRYVLSMTNGHAANPSIEGDWIANYFTAAIEYEPGTRFLYNTSGACMLAAVVKKKTGENVKDYLTPRLFEKIGINAERFVWLKWPNGIDAEPATFATTEDNLRLAILYMNNGRWNGEQIVSEEFIREALSVRIKTDEAPEQKDGRCGYGYQLWACSIPGVYRFDGGQGQYGIIWPEKELCVVVHEGGIAPYGPQETLDVLYEQLLLVADDENLPQDRAAYDELVAYEKSLKIEKDKPNRLHPEIDFSGTYSVISGNADPWIGMAPPGGFDLFAIYRDHSKQEEMTDFSFEFRPDQCRFRVNKDTMIKASMDGELILRETDNVFPQLKNYCATARFVKPYILEIRIHWVNSWAETKMRFEYQKGIMKITSMKLRLNEEDNWLVSRGEAIKVEER